MVSANYWVRCHPELRQTTQPSTMGGPLGDPGLCIFGSSESIIIADKYLRDSPSWVPATYFEIGHLVHFIRYPILTTLHDARIVFPIMPTGWHAVCPNMLRSITHTHICHMYIFYTMILTNLKWPTSCRIYFRMHFLKECLILGSQFYRRLFPASLIMHGSTARGMARN